MNRLLKFVGKLLFLFLLGFYFSTNLAFAQSKINLEKGLIAFYPFNDNADDESGNENEAEVDGANLEKDVSGESNGSYRWNDEDDYIKLPIDINIGAFSQVSLCAWVYPQAYSDKIIVISNDDHGGDRKIFTGLRNRKRVWACSNGKGGFIGKTPVVPRKWVFLVAVYNEKNRTAAIYVDGVKTSGKTTMDMGAEYTLIGANPCGNDDFEALIDEVRIYDRILSKKEIKALRKLKPTIDNFTKEKDDDKKTAYYLVKRNNLIARSQASVKSKIVGKLNKSDTLRFTEAVPSKGGKWNEWLKIKLDGKTAYVKLKYLEHRTAKKDNRSEYEKFMKKNMNLGTWTFWITMLSILILSFLGTFKFGYIDEKLSDLTDNYYTEEVAFFPLIFGFIGFFTAILMVIWQDTIEYFFSNFTLWPSGYGFVTWLVLILVVIAALAYLKLVVESLFCGNIIHGILRIIIQSILGLFTLISVFVITIALIIIVAAVVFGSILLSSLFYRRVYTDMWGNKYVER